MTRNDPKNAEYQRRYREKRAALGETEVRGIYLPPALHATLKKWAESLKRENNSD